MDVRLPGQTVSECQVTCGVFVVFLFFRCVRAEYGLTGNVIIVVRYDFAFRDSDYSPTFFFVAIGCHISHTVPCSILQKI